MSAQSRPASPAPLPAILLTRPAAQGDRFAALLRTRFGPGPRLVVSPLLAPDFLAPPLPADLAGLVFTSETGVAAFARLWRGGALTAWCVGDRTAAAARAAGFAARSAGGDAAALVATLAAVPAPERPPGVLLHARGRESRGDVAAELGRRGWRVEEAVVYDQIAQPLTAVAQALLRGDAPVAAPLFSPRTAGLLARHLPADAPRAPLWVAALSPAVAEAAAAARPARLAVARRPDAEAMVAALAELGFGAAQP